MVGRGEGERDTDTGSSRDSHETDEERERVRLTVKMAEGLLTAGTAAQRSELIRQTTLGKGYCTAQRT